MFRTPNKHSPNCGLRAHFRLCDRVIPCATARSREVTSCQDFLFDGLARLPLARSLRTAPMQRWIHVGSRTPRTLSCLWGFGVSISVTGMRQPLRLRRHPFYLLSTMPEMLLTGLGFESGFIVANNRGNPQVDCTARAPSCWRTTNSGVPGQTVGRAYSEQRRMLPSTKTNIPPKV